MKRYLIAFSLFLISLLGAQDTSKNNKGSYIPVEITKKDGKVMNVLLHKMKVFRITTFKDTFGSSDNYNKAKLEYKTSETSSTEKIDTKEIAQLRFLDRYDDEILRYEKLKIKEFDKNGVLRDRKKEIILPQIYNGKIGIYGDPVTDCFNISDMPDSLHDCDYMYSIFYVKNNQENFAVMPLDINLFDIGRSFDNFVNAFKAAGKECPEFEKYLGFFRKKMEDKNFQKNMRKNIVEYRKKLNKQARANHLNVAETLNFITGKMFFYEAELYIGIVKEYEKNCPY